MATLIDINNILVYYYLYYMVEYGYTNSKYLYTSSNITYYGNALRQIQFAGGHFRDHLCDKATENCRKAIGSAHQGEHGHLKIRDESLRNSPA